jgi:hypothetical protein
MKSARKKMPPGVGFGRTATILSFAAISAIAITGCGSGATDGTSEPAQDSVPVASSDSAKVGTVALDLTLTGGIEVLTVGYEIRKGAFHKTGNVDVSNSTGASVIVDGVPFGNGYVASMDAISTGSPPVSCSGSAPFDVTVATVTTVPVHLTCMEAGHAPPPVTPVPVPPSALLALCALLLASGLALLGRFAPFTREARPK